MRSQWLRHLAIVSALTLAGVSVTTLRQCYGRDRWYAVPIDR